MDQQTKIMQEASQKRYALCEELVTLPFRSERALVGCGQSFVSDFAAICYNHSWLLPPYWTSSSPWRAWSATSATALQLLATGTLMFALVS
eukprot:2818813-Amphidinium_carterae.3